MRERKPASSSKPHTCSGGMGGLSLASLFSKKSKSQLNGIYLPAVPVLIPALRVIPKRERELKAHTLIVSKGLCLRERGQS